MREMTLRTRILARKGLSCTAAPIALGVAVLVGSTAAPAQAQTQCPREITSSASCGCVAVSNVTLKADMLCTNKDGIIVGANGITIRLNGFRIQCKGVGFGLSCQGGDDGDLVDPAEPRDIGIKINGRNSVTVRGGGAIWGFDTGIRVSGSFNVVIQKVNVTAPDADLGALAGGDTTSRPDTEGILVQGTSLGSAIDIFANSVDNHTAGIKLDRAKGVQVRLNFAHDNNGGFSGFGGGEAHGILVFESDNNKINNNLVVDNGVNFPDDSGIMLDGAGSFNNRVNGNNVSFSNGDGISVRQDAANNVVEDNQVLYNTSTETIPDPSRTFFDLAVRTGAGVNTFNANNRCETQGTPSPDDPQISAGVCKSGEGEPWTNKP